MAIQYFRNAQGYFLGTNAAAQTAAGATITLSATAQLPLLLEDLVITSQQADGFTVSEIKLAGQSLMCSNQNFVGKGFSYAAQSEGYRSVSCPIDQNQTFEITIVNGAQAARFGFAVGTTPIAQSQVIPTSQLGQALNYSFGLSNAVVPAGGTAKMTATALRPVTLGRLILSEVGKAGVKFDELEEIEIQSIKVNNIELLSGNATDNPIPAQVCSVYSTLDQDLLLAYPISLNGTIEITLKNNGAADTTVEGGIFVLPDMVE